MIGWVLNFRVHMSLKCAVRLVFTSYFSSFLFSSFGRCWPTWKHLASFSNNCVKSFSEALDKAISIGLHSSIHDIIAADMLPCACTIWNVLSNGGWEQNWFLEWRETLVNFPRKLLLWFIGAMSWWFWGFWAKLPQINTKCLCGTRNAYRLH